MRPARCRAAAPPSYLRSDTGEKDSLKLNTRAIARNTHMGPLNIFYSTFTWRYINAAPVRTMKNSVNLRVYAI